VVEIDGQWEFAPSEEFSASLLEFFKEAEDNGITDDCVDRAILETWNPSWDAWYAAPDANGIAKRYPKPLTYELIQSKC